MNGVAAKCLVILYTPRTQIGLLGSSSLSTVTYIHLKEWPSDVPLFLTNKEACLILYKCMKSLGPQVSELIILPDYSALPSKV